MTPDSFKKRPRILDEDETETFFAEFNERWFAPHRDATICRLMLATGIRVSEALDLTLDRIKQCPGGAKLEIREAKGDQDNVVGIGGEALKDLEKWIERRNEKIAELQADAGEFEDPGYVFITGSGKKVSRQHVHRSIKDKAEAADLPEHDRLHAHCFRHMFAVRWIEDGKGTLEDLRRILSHSSLATTQKYLSLADDSHIKKMIAAQNGGSEESESAEDQNEDDRDSIIAAATW